jgi:hypothetical protein
MDEAMQLTQDNTCVNVLDLDGELKVQSYLLNCTEHLAAGMVAAQ